MNRIFLIILVLLNTEVYAQIIENPMRVDGIKGAMGRDTAKLGSGTERPSDSLKVYIPTISGYQYWVVNGERKTMDTALSIQSYYQQNSYERDLFGYQRPPNHGLTLNPLVYDLDYKRNSILPAGKRYLYISPEEVKYYNVQTPTTHFSYENGMKEGQFLSSFFTHNIHQRFNYALSFNSLNSRGVYQRQETDNKNFRISLNYKTKNERYQALANVMSQKLQSQESAGVDQVGLEAFKENNDLFSNRQRMAPNLTGSDARFRSKSLYINQIFGLFKVQNTEDTAKFIYPIKLKNIVEWEQQDYAFMQSNEEPYYQSLPLVAEKVNYRKDKKFNTLKLYAGLQYQWSERLWIDAGAVFRQQKLSFDTATTAVSQAYNNAQFGVEGILKFNLSDRIRLVGETQFLQGTNFGSEYFIDGKLNFSILKGYELKAGLKLGDRKPSFNLLLHQSFYQKFNYNHIGYDNESYQTITGELSLAPLALTLSAQLSNILNYTYLDGEYNIVQSGSPVNYFKILANKRQHFGKFHVDATAQYQLVTSGKEKLPLPKVLARLSAYYKTNLFDNNATVIGGVAATYYSSFKSRAFLPVLNEWYLQDNQEIGNYPYVDLFMNLKVRQMRIYIRGENITSFLLKGKYLYTPHQPAKDFKIQIGINWYLFS